MMIEDEYEVWICLSDNMCTQGMDSFCYIYNEKLQVYEPWGLNSYLKMVSVDLGHTIPPTPAPPLPMGCEPGKEQVSCIDCIPGCINCMVGSFKGSTYLL